MFRSVYYSLLFILTPFILRGQTPKLIKDINPGSAFSDVGPNYSASINGILFFAAQEPATGIELWRSDGTADGTYLVKDIALGTNSGSPGNLITVSNILYFTASDGISGGELWRSDGTAEGTYLVKDIIPGANGSSPYYLTNVNGTIYFRASYNPNDIGQTRLWRSDGTASGTLLVPGGQAAVRQLTEANGILYFVAIDLVAGQAGFELWAINGPTSDPYLVKDINPGPASSDPSQLTNVNGILYFLAYDGVTGIELWRSDGTATGTYQVKDLTPGNNQTSTEKINNLTNVNGTLFFTFDDYGSAGRELWRSDGTATGTYQVKDIYPGFIGSYPQNLTNVNGKLFFSATDGVSGTELWQSDGTNSGTYLMKDIYAGSSGSDLTNFINVNGILYFNANNGSTGSELWRSDGTGNGTNLVLDIYPGYASAYPTLQTNVNGTLFFFANDGMHGREPCALTDLPKPDLTPILYARPSIAVGTTEFSVVVDAVEINNQSSSVSFTVRITKDNRLNLTFPATATSVGNRAVQNSAWTFDNSDSNYYMFTTIQPIKAGDKLSLGLVGNIIPGSTSGILTLSSTILSGSIAEAKLTNNIDAEKTDYFQ